MKLVAAERSRFKKFTARVFCIIFRRLAIQTKGASDNQMALKLNIFVLLVLHILAETSFALLQPKTGG